MGSDIFPSPLSWKAEFYFHGTNIKIPEKQYGNALLLKYDTFEKHPLLPNPGVSLKF